MSFVGHFVTFLKMLTNINRIVSNTYSFSNTDGVVAHFSELWSQSGIMWYSVRVIGFILVTILRGQFGFIFIKFGHDVYLDIFYATCESGSNWVKNKFKTTNLRCKFVTTLEAILMRQSWSKFVSLIILVISNQSLKWCKKLGLWVYTLQNFLPPKCQICDLILKIFATSKFWLWVGDLWTIVMWDQKLGHQVKSLRKNLVATVEVLCVTL